MDDPQDPLDFISYGIPRQGPRMPLSVAELMEGARERVEVLMLQLKREKAEADYYVGLEGGFHVVDSEGPRRKVFLESWAYVCDGQTGSYGHGGGIMVPPCLSDPVIDRGIELGIVVDRISQQRELRGRQGTWGILTCDILTRKHSFVVALIAAFAPFYNPELYDRHR